MTEFVTNEGDSPCGSYAALRNSPPSAEAGIIGEMPDAELCVPILTDPDGMVVGRDESTLVISLRRCLPTLLSISIVVTQGAAVICQIVQGTDPRSPLLYFSVDSAVLAGVVAVLTLWGWQGKWLARVRLTSAVGVLVSAIVFAAVIAPASETGAWLQPHDDLWVRAATVLMHGIAPVFVTLDVVVRGYADSVRCAVVWSYLWPLIYVVGLIVLAVIVGSHVIPYPFLRPASMGWPTVAAAVVVLAVLVGVLGALVAAMSRARRWPEGRDRDPEHGRCVEDVFNISNGPTSRKI